MRKIYFQKKCPGVSSDLKETKSANLNIFEIDYYFLNHL